mmetsp:Transcript_130335/g.325095  ORF Transcript_130335/g.325095 Transcript_130335/m.325095 type:complete len:593 (-) Transcript_130335:389-2167(-)
MRASHRSWQHAAHPLHLFGALCLVRSSAAGGWLRSSRRLDHAEGEYIWGICDDWTHNVTGCSLDDDMKCSSYLSPGPEDADVEIMIHQLPPSVEGKEVHLHWWSPRKSPFEYDPLKSPHGCAVYWDMRKAYPKHDEAEFNGGNVRVSENGTAMIRVRQPSTYRVHRWVLYPHIHIRLCSGENFAHAHPDQVFFSRGGPIYVRGVHGHNHSAARQMLEKAMYAAGHEPSGPRETSSTLEPSSSSLDGDELAQVPNNAGDGGTDGILLSDTSGLDDLRIQDAKEALDLDALEFSPVYQCLLEGTFFSYYSSKCVESCPPEAEVHVGQCVRKNSAATAVTLKAVWALDLACDETCWHDKLTVTLHHVRIAVADQLRIPFQEVEHASLGLALAASRRLSDGTEIQEAMLQVRVQSRRVEAAVDGPLLKALLGRPEDASWLLGFDVHGVSVASEEEWKEEGYTVLTDSSDPYSQAYNDEVKQNGGGATSGVLPMEFLPVEVIIGIAIAVVLIGTAIVFYLYRRRKVVTLQAREGQIPVVTGRPTKTVDDDGPTKPSTVGVPTADDDDQLGKPQQATGGAGIGMPSNTAAEAADASRI